MSDGARKSEQDLAAELRLRPERPKVTRLSRRVLAGLAGVSSLAIMAALVWALQGRAPQDDSPELYTTENRPTADGFETLPRDYAGLPPKSPPPIGSGVPQLGPPLPGDLGRPILSARERGQDVPIGPQPADPALQEGEAARVSKLFFGANAETGSSRSGAPAQNSSASAGSGGLDAAQDGKLAFLNGPVDRRTVSEERLQVVASPYVVQAGSIIAAALVTGIRSDLPGQVTAQVTEHVYDSPTGRHLLIPQGAKLIGVYDAQVSFGQSRVLLVWNRLILPDGRSIVLERAPAADTEGYAGLQDGVNYHSRRLFLAAGLSTLLGIGAELGSDGEDDIASAIRESAQSTVNQTGQEIVERQLVVAPTLTVRPGFPVRVIVNRDLVLEPYRS